MEKIKTKIRRRISFRLILLAMLMLVGGTSMLLSNLELIEFDVQKYVFTWQSAIIALGLFYWAGSFRSNWFGGSILISIGTIFLLDKIYGETLSISSILWPVIIMIIGLAILLKVLLPKSKKYASCYSGVFDGNSYSKNDDILEEDRIFGGGNIQVLSQNFKGGNLSYVFGGGDIDLREAKLAEGNNIMKIDCVFGGVKLKVPENWDISVESSGVFGGFNDARVRVSPENIDKSRKLIIKIEAVFGGGEIVN